MRDACLLLCARRAAGPTMQQCGATHGALLAELLTVPLELVAIAVLEPAEVELEAA